MTFLPKSKIEVKKINREWNPTSHPELEYLSGPAILVSLIVPNRQYFNAKSAFRSREHISNFFKK